MNKEQILISLFHIFDEVLEHIPEEYYDDIDKVIDAIRENYPDKVK